MTAALVTLAVALLAAAGTAVGLALALVRAERGASRLELLAGQSRAQADELAVDLATSRMAHLDERNRLEEVVVQQKAGLRQLEEDIDACQDPGVVRDRLRRLLQLGGKTPVAGAAAAPAIERVPG